MLIKQLRIAFGMTLAFTILTGLIYPLIVTGIAQLLFPHKANGSLIYVDGKVVGSELIGQWFTDPRYFWPRLSATSGFPYNAARSGGSNYSVMNEDLATAVKARLDQLQRDGFQSSQIPVDLVTSSASGLDPHISPASAQVQAARIAAVRGLSIEQVNGLIQQFTEGRELGLLGEPRVNVLKINLALDQLK